jgi:hypothetical protein
MFQQLWTHSRRLPSPSLPAAPSPSSGVIPAAESQETAQHFPTWCFPPEHVQTHLLSGVSNNEMSSVFVCHGRVLKALGVQVAMLGNEEAHGPGVTSPWSFINGASRVTFGSQRPAHQ